MEYSTQAYGVYELTQVGHLRRIHYCHIGINSLSTHFYINRFWGEPTYFKLSRLLPSFVTKFLLFPIVLPPTIWSTQPKVIVLFVPY